MHSAHWHLQAHHVKCRPSDVLRQSPLTKRSCSLLLSQTRSLPGYARRVSLFFITTGRECGLFQQSMWTGKTNPLTSIQKDLSNSKDLTTALTRAYPFKKPGNPGGIRGKFRNLDLLVAFVIDPGLSRRAAGDLFVCNDDLLHKLNACKIGGADSLQAKQKRLALCMIEFTNVLMIAYVHGI